MVKGRVEHMNDTQLRNLLAIHARKLQLYLENK